MTWGRLIALLALVGLVLYCRGPSASSIVGDTLISVEEGWLDYKDTRLDADWGPLETRVGNARLFERAKYKSAPYFTHHVVLTTGQFSDSEFVSIRHNGGGNFIWSAPKKPEGSIIVLHMIPLDTDVLDQLEAIDDGDLVEIVGRDEVDSKIAGDDGSWIQLNHSNHKYLLVEQVGPAVD